MKLTIRIGFCVALAGLGFLTAVAGQGAGYVIKYDNVMKTCHGDHSISGAKEDSLDKCKRKCDLDERCKFVFYNTNTNCPLYESCDTTTTTTYVGTTFEKQESYYFFVENVYLDNGSRGQPAGTTCETLGYGSIITKDECYKEYKSIPDIASYTTYHTELGCFGYYPNHCFTDDAKRRIYFTAAHCGVHTDPSGESFRLICKQSQKDA